MRKPSTVSRICLSYLILKTCQNEKQIFYTAFTDIQLVLHVAISSNLLPTMIRQLMKTCELNAFEASFTEAAYWLAYFLFPIPIAMFMKRFSYKFV